MENFDMSQFVTEEEMEQAEKENERLENEMLAQYDRMIFCEDPARINELVKNVFGVAQSMDTNNMFYESNDNYIKWSLQALSANPSQFLIVEGLLSHRMKAGLLTGMFEDENEKPFAVLPSNAPVLKGSAYLGKIKDMKQVNAIIDNVVKVAGIPTDENSKNIAIFEEPLNPALPQMTGFCIALINLDEQQMSNLKKASKVKKVSDKMTKMVDNFNTSGYGIAKMGLEGVVTPGVQMATKLGGLAVGTGITATAKGAMTFADEVTGAIARADLPHCKEVSSIKSNCAKIAMQFNRGQKDDSFSFSF